VQLGITIGRSWRDA